jgi:hypothetical protein
MFHREEVHLLHCGADVWSVSLLSRLFNELLHPVNRLLQRHCLLHVPGHMTSVRGVKQNLHKSENSQ